MIRALRRLAVEMMAVSPRRAVASLLLMLAMSFTEGLGLLLLMPLLTLVGVEEPNTLPNVTGWFDAAFRAVGLAPSLGSVLTLFVGIAACRALLQRWQIALGASLRESFTSAFRVRMYRAVAEAQWQFLVTRKPSEFAHVLSSEIGRIGSAASQVFDVAVVATVSLVYVGLAFHLSPATAGLVLLCAATLAWSVRGTLDRARASGARAASARSILHAAIAEHMGSLKTAKSYGVTERHTDIFLRLSHELRDISLEVSAEESDLQQGLEFGSTALLAFIVFVALRILHVPAAPMLVLLFTFARLMPRLVTVYRRVQALAGALPVYESVSRLEQECLEAAEQANQSGQDVPFSRTIRFDDVSFAYPRRTTPAVRGIHLEIPAGLTTAIVGPSGAGKSTVADLLIGLLSPTSGRILVDGKPLRPETLATWRRRISYVPQDTFLFHDTVRANLNWARPDATEPDLARALHSAAADEFVAALPHGLDSIVGERGVLVSGGERQRVSLARALLREPGILVLDEATSSLDSENELRIQRAIENLHHQMTIVVITHRLSTIRHADVIHVFEGGLLVQSGTWDQLLADRRGRFRQLCFAQGIGEDTTWPAALDIA